LSFPPATRTVIEAFLTNLAVRDASASSQNQAFNAILLFYKEVLGQQNGNVNPSS
jgi:hypothetical protein